VRRVIPSTRASSCSDHRKRTGAPDTNSAIALFGIGSLASLPARRKSESVRVAAPHPNPLPIGVQEWGEGTRMVSMARLRRQTALSLASHQ